MTVLVSEMPKLFQGTSQGALDLALDTLERLRKANTLTGHPGPSLRDDELLLFALCQMLETPDPTEDRVEVHGKLEILTTEGRIYFHDLHGKTLLRIGHLPAPVPVPMSNPTGRLATETLDIQFSKLGGFTGPRALSAMASWDGKVRQ